MFKCVERGKDEDPNRWLNGSALEQAQRCFSCQHWAELVPKAHLPESVRVGGEHFLIGPDEPGTPSRWLGYGGQRWIIRFFNGRVVETNNLWRQGDIPPHFRDRLPDNATREAVWPAAATGAGGAVGAKAGE